MISSEECNGNHIFVVSRRIDDSKRNNLPLKHIPALPSLKRESFTIETRLLISTNTITYHCKIYRHFFFYFLILVKKQLKK